MKRALTGGYELDDDRARIDVEAVHAFLSSEAYWAIGRSPEHVARLVREASRVVGLYHDGHQVGFCRAVSDDTAFAYLADVYVLPEHRGRGLGLELVREMVDRGPFARRTWILHTEDMHAVYAKLGPSRAGSCSSGRVPPRPRKVPKNSRLRHTRARTGQVASRPREAGCEPHPGWGCARRYAPPPAPRDGAA